MHVFAQPGAQIDDRINDQLSGPVIGHIAAAPRLEQLDAELAPPSLVRQHVLRMRRCAESDDVRVLQQQQLVRDGPGAPLPHQALLQPQRVAVRDEAEPPDLVDPDERGQVGGCGIQGFRAARRRGAGGQDRSGGLGEALEELFQRGEEARRVGSIYEPVIVTE